MPFKNGAHGAPYNGGRPCDDGMNRRFGGLFVVRQAFDRCTECTLRPSGMAGNQGVGCAMRTDQASAPARDGGAI
jgi:hypothetical protein